MRSPVWAALGLLLVMVAGNPLAPFARAAASSSVPVAPTRGIIFVHGIHGDARFPGFPALLQPLARAYPKSFESFTYFDDVANRNASTQQCAARSLPRYTPVSGFPVDAPAAGAPAFCDSEDDVGLNAILLDQDIVRRTRQWNSNRVTLVANSMGAAIVRAYLAYATRTGSSSLARVDSVLLLHGANEGSWITRADQIGNSMWASSIPGVRTAVAAMEQLASDQFHIDRQRPAIADLTPESQMYIFDSQAQYLPAIRYANVVSDITTRVATRVWWWTVTADLPVRLGDYVMVPGFDDPTRTDWMGGARFLPSAIGRGKSSTQWILPGEATIQRQTAADGSAFWDLTEVFNAPMSHFQLGSQLAQLQVDTVAGRASLDRALLNWIAALDGSAGVPLTALATGPLQRDVGGSPAAGVPAPSLLNSDAGTTGSVRPVNRPTALPRTPPPPPAMTFVDQQSGLVLVLPPPGDTSRQDATFAVQVPERGVYTGPLGPASQQVDPTTIRVAYDGPASLGPLIGASSGTPPAQRVPVAVQFRANVDLVHDSATATLSEGDRHFHLVSQPASGGRDAALATFEAASLAADFRSLHRVLSDDIAGARTPASLAAEGARLVSQAGRLRWLRRLAVGNVDLSRDGVHTFRVSYDAERQAPDGSVTSGRFVATFLQQGAVWRLWFMDSLS